MKFSKQILSILLAVVLVFVCVLVLQTVGSSSAKEGNKGNKGNKGQKWDCLNQTYYNKSVSAACKNAIGPHTNKPNCADKNYVVNANGYPGTMGTYPAHPCSYWVGKSE